MCRPPTFGAQRAEEQEVRADGVFTARLTGIVGDVAAARRTDEVP